MSQGLGFEVTPKISQNVPEFWAGQSLNNEPTELDTKLPKWAKLINMLCFYGFIDDGPYDLFGWSPQTKNV